ncbi:MAG: dihydropteroate synthase [Selenomonadaceae bacterium]
MEREINLPSGKRLVIGEKTLVMGILNVTPDSFSDGGEWNTTEKALAHARAMIDDGADIIDVGAESSRPGFVPMSAEDEIKRLRPFMEALKGKIDVPISIDTFKAETVEFAASMGADIVNDIWGLQYAADESYEMAHVAARHGMAVVVMHNQNGTEYDGDIIDEMKRFFARSIDIARYAGIDEDKIIIDPGIGFGKTVEQNLEVLKRLDELSDIEGACYPLLLGTSRKSFIGKTLGLDVDERMEATGVTCVMGIERGADIVRVHDVRPIVRMCRMTDAVLKI